MEPRTYGWEPGSRTPLLSFTLVMAPVNVSTWQQSIELIQNQYGYFFSSESVDLIGLHVAPVTPHPPGLTGVRRRLGTGAR